MWIEILQSSDVRQWYFNKIGQKFKVLEFKDGFFKVRDNHGFVNFVTEENARIVEWLLFITFCKLASVAGYENRFSYL